MDEKKNADKIRELEERIKRLERCKHQYEGPYFNMCNAYYECVKCGHKSRT